jgi:D-alanyl-D-alanine carboxypeptidase (penicillin-binding protein 5/6)
MIKLLTKKNNFLFLLMLSLVFISSTAMSLGKSQPAKVSVASIFNLPKSKTFPPNPVLGEKTAFPILSAQGAIAIDMDSGVPLYEKNPDAPLLPASTTKIVTALVALDLYDPDTVLTVGTKSVVVGQKMGLFVGEKMRMEDLLYGLLVYSANDAAEALAENHPQGYDEFIEDMNKKARDLHMTNSHFENPVGLDGNAHRSTARDLVRASEIAMRNPIFSKIVGTKEIVITDASGKYSYDLVNLNKLLGVVPGVIGVKTGWTESARENLVTYVTRDGHEILITLLGSQDRFGETKELIDWVFASYDWTEVKTP